MNWYDCFKRVLTTNVCASEKEQKSVREYFNRFECEEGRD